MGTRRRFQGVALLALFAAQLPAVAASSHTKGPRAGPPQGPAAYLGGAGDYRLRTAPAKIVLGKSKVVSLLVEAPGRASKTSALRVAVNVGRVVAVGPGPRGQTRVRYALPKSRAPKMLNLVVWRDTGKARTLALFRIPLFGSAKVPIEAPPGASVVALLAGVRLPAVVADRRGRATLKFQVPPGVRELLIEVSKGGGPPTASTIPLPLPQYNRLTLALTPQQVPLDGKSEAEVVAFYAASGSVPLAPGKLKLTASGGHLGAVSKLGSFLAARFKAPLKGSSLKAVTLKASVVGDAASAASATLGLGPPRVDHIELKLSPARILGDGQETVQVEFRVLDAQELPVQGAKVKLRADFPGHGGKPEALERMGPGRFRFQVAAMSLPAKRRTPASGTLTVIAGGVSKVATLWVDPWRPVKVEVEPKSLAMVADGRTRAQLRIRVLDLRGRPMAHQTVHVEAAVGKLSQPMEGPAGVYTVSYIPPRLQQQFVGEVGAETRTRDSLRVSVEELRGQALQVPLDLSPVRTVIGGRKHYAELLAGYGDDFRLLQGAALHLGFGRRLGQTGRLRLDLGLRLDLDYAPATLSYELAGLARTAGFSLGQAGLSLELRASVLGSWWQLSLVLGGGGQGSLATIHYGSSQAEPARSLARSLGYGLQSRLVFGISAGPGRVLLEAGVARVTLYQLGSALFGVDGAHYRPSAALGYRLEL